MIKEVVFISHMFPNNAQKSSGTFVLEQVKALTANGVRVIVLRGEADVFSCRKPISMLRNLYQWHRTNSYSSIEENGDYAIVRFKYPLISHRLNLELSSYFYARGALKAYRTIAKLCRPQLIHAHTALLDGNAARLLKKKFNISYVITEHTGPFNLLTKNVFRKWRTGKALVGADKVVAVSQFQKKSILALFPKLNIDVVWNTVNTDFYSPIVFQEVNVNPRPTNPNKVIFGWLGHYDAVKQVDILVDAFATVLKRTQANTELHLIGNGPEVQSIQNQVQKLGLTEKVLFFCPKDQTQVKTLLQKIDCLVVSSRVETFSMACIEAMSLGKPVISTRCGGPEDFITDPKVGQLTEGTVDELALAMQGIGDKKFKYEVASIRDYCIEQFGYQSFFNKMKKLYGALV